MRKINCILHNVAGRSPQTSIDNYLVDRLHSPLTARLSFYLNVWYISFSIPQYHTTSWSSSMIDTVYPMYGYRRLETKTRKNFQNNNADKSGIHSSRLWKTKYYEIIRSNIDIVLDFCVSVLVCVSCLLYLFFEMVLPVWYLVNIQGRRSLLMKRLALDGLLIYPL